MPASASPSSTLVSTSRTSSSSDTTLAPRASTNPSPYVSRVLAHLADRFTGVAPHRDFRLGQDQAQTVVAEIGRRVHPGRVVRRA